jgi:DNA invertase Pin-like site-specific DNA recombinase
VDGATKAVVYAAKSTEDKHGSIPTQLGDCRAMAEREGWEVVAECQDENASAYHGSRGDGLAQAKAHAEALVGEGHRVILITQHSDRLARGDGGKQAAHLVEFSLWRAKSGVEIRSVQDDATWTTPMGHLIPALMGERNFEDSRRKGLAVKDGLDRRRGRGQPVGAMPFGWTVEKEVINGNVVTRRVVDPTTGPIRVEILKRVADGATPGGIARWLNRQGVKTRRGKQFTRRAVSEIVESAANDGGGGYPALVSAELAQAARDGLRRLDPVAVQDRVGGRSPRDESYILRGVGFCAACGSPLYATKNYLGGRRGYACRDKLESRGLCGSLPIAADLLETHVLNHLQSFIGSVEGWIADLLTKRDAERNVRVGQLEQERAALATLDRQRDERMAELEQVGMTKIGMEVIERIDAKREAQANRIAEAEAVVAEWTAPPNIDATLDFYSDLVDLVQGRVSKAIGVRELNDALRGVLAGLWCEIEPERDRLLVQFELREQPAVKLPDGSPFLLADYNGRRDRLWLPPARVSGVSRAEALRSEGHRSVRCSA